MEKGARAFLKVQFASESLSSAQIIDILAYLQEGTFSTTGRSSDQIDFALDECEVRDAKSESRRVYTRLGAPSERRVMQSDESLLLRFELRLRLDSVRVTFGELVDHFGLPSARLKSGSLHHAGRC